jgi:hypothetical protein
LVRSHTGVSLIMPGLPSSRSQCVLSGLKLYVYISSALGAVFRGSTQKSLGSLAGSRQYAGVQTRLRGGVSQNTENPNLVAAIVFGGALAWGGIAATQHIPLLAPAGPDMKATRGITRGRDTIAFFIVLLPSLRLQAVQTPAVHLDAGAPRDRALAKKGRVPPRSSRDRSDFVLTLPRRESAVPPWRSVPRSPGGTRPAVEGFVLS